MSNTVKGILITVGIVLVLVVSVSSWWIGTSNAEITLRAKVEAQQEMTEAFYTKLWEIIKTQAKVADEYAEQFKEIQVGIMEGRYSTGGEMMKWIQESNPEFDASMYKKLMNSIEGERNGFFIEQKKLRDMNAQHDIMLRTFPSIVVVGDREPIEVIILTNIATKKAYETGTDSSPDLF